MATGLERVAVPDRSTTQPTVRVGTAGIVAARWLIAATWAPAPPQSPEVVVAGIIEQVERLRGHEFASDPTVEFVADAG